MFKSPIEMYEQISKIQIQLPTFLTNENMWSSAIGAIVGALVILGFQWKNTKDDEVIKINHLKVLLMAVFSSVAPVRKKYILPINDDLLNAHAIRNKVMAEKREKYIDIPRNRYMTKHPSLELDYKTIVKIVSTTLPRSPNTLLAAYQLANAATNLMATLKERNSIIKYFLQQTTPTTDEERSEQAEKIYGFPGKHVQDTTMVDLTKSLEIYSNDVLLLCKHMLDNTDKIVGRTLWWFQRKNICKPEIFPEYLALIRSDPAMDRIIDATLERV